MRVRRDLIWGNAPEGFRAFIVNENDGIVGDSYFFKYLQQYVALLFLRLYTLPAYYTYGDPFAEVYTPTDITEKKFWLENLKSFNEYINQVSTDGIPQLVGLTEVTQGWLSENENSPNVIIEKLKNKIERELNEIHRNQPLDENKIEVLKSKSKEIFSKIKSNIEQVFVPQNELKSLPDSAYNCIVPKIYDRAVFFENGGISYINFDSFTARLLVDQLLVRLISQFSKFFANGIYALKVEDILPAIDKILAKKVGSEYEIVCFSCSLLNFSETRSSIVESNGLLSYKGTDIIELHTGGFRNELTGKLCIIKKVDKPKIRFVEPEERDRYGLTELPDNSKCYYNLIEYENKNDLNFSESEVCVVLAAKAEVEWIDNVEAVFIKPVFGYRQNDEAPQSVDEVTSFK